MADYLISPAEPRLIRAMGKTSSLPESIGCDLVWSERQLGGLIGIQRKEVTDFLASVTDGRLAHGYQKMRNLKLAVLVIEGRMRWGTNNHLLSPPNHTAITRAQWRSMLRTCQHQGLYVDFSDDVADTITLIEEIASWARKAEHTLLSRRPNPGTNMWGQVTDDAWMIHLLQSFEGIGPKQARSIIDAFDGALPLCWSVDETTLKKVPGLGPKRVASLLRGLRCITTPMLTNTADVGQ